MEHQHILPLAIISFIFLTWLFDYLVIMGGEIPCWSRLELIEDLRMQE